MTQHTDSVEALKERAEYLGSPYAESMSDQERLVALIHMAQSVPQVLTTLQANQSQQVEEAVRKYLQEKVVLYVSDNQSHESLSHEDRLKINADECIIYLGDDVKDVWGDDWNDAPDYCNSGSPYENTVKGLVKIEVKLGKPLLTPNHQD